MMMDNRSIFLIAFEQMFLDFFFQSRSIPPYDQLDHYTLDKDQHERK